MRSDTEIVASPVSISSSETDDFKGFSSSDKLDKKLFNYFVEVVPEQNPNQIVNQLENVTNSEYFSCKGGCP